MSHRPQVPKNKAERRRHFIHKARKKAEARAKRLEKSHRYARILSELVREQPTGTPFSGTDRDSA